MTCWLKGFIPRGFSDWLDAPHAHDCAVVALIWKKAVLVSCNTKIKSFRFSISPFFFSSQCLFHLSQSDRRVLHFRKCLVYILTAFYLIKSEYFSHPEHAEASCSDQCSSSYIGSVTTRWLSWRGQEEGNTMGMQSWHPYVPCPAALQYITHIVPSHAAGKKMVQYIITSSPHDLAVQGSLEYHQRTLPDSLY